MLALNGAILVIGARGDKCQGGTTGVQMREMASGDMVGPGRAARAPLVQRLASFPQPHEMVDDELKATFEQVEQTRFSVGTFEDIVLLDPDHRQPAALGVQRVPATGEFLLSWRAVPCEQRATRLASPLLEVQCRLLS